MARKRAAAKPSKAKLDPALMRAAADGAAIQMRDKTIALGHFSGVTGNGFRLICEDGSLVFVATSEKPLTPALTRAVTERCKWIIANRDVVDARWRAVVGPALPPPPLIVRVVAPGTDKKCEQQLASLPACVQTRVYRLARNGDAFDLHFTTVDLPRSPAAHPHLAALLLEARCAARVALAREIPRDPIDWRTSRDYQLLRVYGLLVAAASTLTVLGARPSGRKPKGNVGLSADCLGLRVEILDLLEALASSVSRDQFICADRHVAKTLRTVRDLVTSLYGDETRHESGAFSGHSWRVPVPPSLHALLSSMAADATTNAKQQAVAHRPTRALLADANVAIATSVHLGRTADDFRFPADSSGNDTAYLKAALIRVLAGHRILLEILARNDHDAVLALLGLGEDLALRKSAVRQLFTNNDDDREALGALQLTSLGVLRKAVTLRQRLKHGDPGLATAAAQERVVLSALVTLLVTQQQ